VSITSSRTQRPEALLRGVDLAEQAGVDDGDGGLLAETPGELQLGSGDGPLLVHVIEPQHPDALLAEPQRHAQHGLLAVDLHALLAIGGKVAVADMLDGGPVGKDDRPLARPGRKRVGRAELVVGHAGRLAFVEGPVDDGFVFGHMFVDDRLRHGQRGRGLARHAIEHLIEVDGRGDGPAGVDQRGHEPRLFFLAAEHLGVVDGDGRHHAELLEQLALGVGEVAHVTGLGDAERADHLVAEPQRRVEGGFLTPLLVGRAFLGGKIGIVDVALHRAPALEQTAKLRPLVERRDRSHVGPVLVAHAATTPVSLVDQRVALGRVVPDVDPPDVHDLADTSGDSRQHVFEDKAGSERRAQLENGSLAVFSGHVAPLVPVFPGTASRRWAGRHRLSRTRPTGPSRR